MIDWINDLVLEYSNSIDVIYFVSILVAFILIYISIKKLSAHVRELYNAQKMTDSDIKNLSNCSDEYDYELLESTDVEVYCVDNTRPYKPIDFNTVNGEERRTDYCNIYWSKCDKINSVTYSDSVKHIRLNYGEHAKFYTNTLFVITRDNFYLQFELPPELINKGLTMSQYEEPNGEVVIELTNRSDIPVFIKFSSRIAIFRLCRVNDVNFYMHDANPENSHIINKTLSTHTPHETINENYSVEELIKMGEETDKLTLANPIKGEEKHG